MGFDFPWVYPVRGVQAVFAIIVLGLAGHITSIFDNYVYGESEWLNRVNFMVFNGVWTFFIVVPLFTIVPIFFPVVSHKFVTLGVDAVTMIFWLAGWAAMADALSGTEAGCKSVGWCKEAQAATVFGSFEWALFVATTVLSALAAFRSGSSSTQQQPQTTVVP